MITSDTILTAAHCVTGDPSNGCSVLGGSAVIGTRNLVYTEAGSEEIELTSCIVHPGYDISSGLPKNDFAIVKLNKKSEFTPVWLDDGTIPLKMSDSVTAMGWGRTHHFSREKSVQLMQVGLEYMTIEKCRSMWAEVLKNEEMDVRITNSHLCVWRDKTEMKSHYRGDSGGPLVVSSIGSQTYQDIQVGVVSFSYKDFDNYAHIPPVYARVGDAAEWIKENTVGVKFVKITQISIPSTIPWGTIGVTLTALVIGIGSGVGIQEIRYKNN